MCWGVFPIHSLVLTGDAQTLQHFWHCAPEADAAELELVTVLFELVESSEIVEVEVGDEPEALVVATAFGGGGHLRLNFGVVDRLSVMAN